MIKSIGLCVLVSLAIAPAALAQKITKQTFTSDGSERTYYLFVPDRAGTSPRRSCPAARLRPRRQDARRALAVAGQEGRPRARRPRCHRRAGWSMRDDGRCCCGT